MAKKDKDQEYNLLELRPERLFESETTDEGLDRVLVPRFRNAFLRRFLVPRNRDPYVHVKLDMYCTAIWRMCDGRTPVARMVAALEERFGEEVAPADERVAAFIRQMRMYQYISLKTADGTVV